MKWSEITIQTSDEAVEAISNILHEAGASGVVIEDPRDLQRNWSTPFGEIYDLNPAEYPTEGVILKAYLLDNDELSRKIDDIHQAIENLRQFEINIGLNRISVGEVNEEEWANAWKQYYHPVRISECFTVVPTWEDYEPASEQEKIIQLDPGMAFGTGTHATTVLCLRALEKAVHEGDHVVDVGTGSGILSIGAAMLGASSVRALDLDDVAVKVSKENIALNKVEETISVEKNNLLHGIKEQADVIVANILADVILLFTDDAYRLLKHNGYFVVSGIIKEKKQLVLDGLQQSGFEDPEVSEQEDWVCITVRKL
ncbi:50S ribosomal protein L11 methyltransferase [Bacillus sp. HMF5848]|uniref:50S ribosomal protein L11 methyltransferase n=1 Tax=Bacillus sp. HMF5848 TaxID=2495421 RepID=UPI000F7AE4E4|nr:50S ribosomal protein L11 methyltransferase [Bacillus sp. HMF5848]RSK27901.1 50S ribosomal protein L11 methyltransferase [Bacillus sp. HMF5848]